MSSSSSFRPPPSRTHSPHCPRTPALPRVPRLPSCRWDSGKPPSRYWEIDAGRAGLGRRGYDGLGRPRGEGGTAVRQRLEVRRHLFYNGGKKMCIHIVYMFMPQSKTIMCILTHDGDRKMCLLIMLMPQLR